MRTVTMRYGQAGERSTTGETATLLWSNASPSASFSAQTVTLSQSASSYDRLRIVWKASTGGTVNYPVDYDLSNIEGYIASSASHVQFSFGYYGTSYRMSRSAWFTDTNYTGVQFQACYRTNNTTTNNGGCIPVAIYGVKL